MKANLYRIIFIFCTLFSFKAYSNEFVKIDEVDLTRTNEAITNRSHNYIEHIYNVSEKYNLEPWMILGIIINESNSTNIVSKSGYDYGLGQIRCFDKSQTDKKGFSWLKFLKEKAGITSCKDLLVPEINIKCIAVILNYIKTSYKKKHDRHILTYYHKGVRWNKYDRGYYSRVFIYGKLSLSKYPERKIKWCS